MYRTMLQKSRTNRRGFTLIELLVVVLILAILMAVALPLYLNAVSDARIKTCRANMQTIAGSVQSARVRANAADYAAYIGAVSVALEPDLGTVPKCPLAGAYTVELGAAGAGTFRVKCSQAAHGTFEPGVDTN